MTIVVSGVLLAAVTLFLLFTSSTDNTVVWLTPAQFVRSTQPGPFTQFKYKLVNLTAPLWRHLRRSRPAINIASSLLTHSSAAIEQTGLGAPATTNLDGLRAWILTRSESDTLQQRIKTNTGVSVLGSPRIQTINGGQARVFVGNSASGPGALQTGISIDLIPKTSSDLIRLTISASATEKAESPANAALVRTNFAMACQATIPSGGCLVLDCGPPKDGSGKRYWMIVSPTAIDAQGNPIKR